MPSVAAGKMSGSVVKFARPRNIRCHQKDDGEMSLRGEGGFGLKWEMVIPTEDAFHE